MPPLVEELQISLLFGLNPLADFGSIQHDCASKYKYVARMTAGASKTGGCQRLGSKKEIAIIYKYQYTVPVIQIASRQKRHALRRAFLKKILIKLFCTLQVEHGQIPLCFVSRQGHGFEVRVQGQLQRLSRVGWRRPPRQYAATSGQQPRL
jgi:hypothetical protein